MADHEVREGVKDIKGKRCDEVEEEPGAEVVHLAVTIIIISNVNQM